MTGTLSPGDRPESGNGLNGPRALVTGLPRGTA